MRGKPTQNDKKYHVREKFTTVGVCDHYTIRTKMYDTGNTSVLQYLVVNTLNLFLAQFHL